MQLTCLHKRVSQAGILIFVDRAVKVRYPITSPTEWLLSRLKSPSQKEHREMNSSATDGVEPPATTPAYHCDVEEDFEASYKLQVTNSFL